jgi:hypothetical protein
MFESGYSIFPILISFFLFAGPPSGQADFVRPLFFFRLDLRLTGKSTVATMYLFVISWAEVYAAA